MKPKHSIGLQLPVKSRVHFPKFELYSSPALALIDTTIRRQTIFPAKSSGIICLSAIIMAKNLIQRPLIFQDENSDIYFKKGVITGKSKSGKPEAVKKGTIGLKSRNALNDITNKSTALPEEAAKKKSSQKEVKVPSELNIAEETFQHDHKKCVEAQSSGMTLKHFMELVLPGCDSASHIDIPKTEMGMNDKGIDNSHCYPVPEELSMSEFSWLRSLWDPSSPKKRDSPASSPSEWAFEPVEFTLNEEKDC